MKLIAQRSQSIRSSYGSMLAFIVAITATAIIALLFFSYKYTRILGGFQEQRTAIEAAALAAASDLSKIVIKDPNCGFISLSDDAPTATNPAVLAPDQYALPVTGINTLLATARLDMIIADSLGESIMQQCARADYANAITAKNSLVAALLAAVAPSGSGLDKNLNLVDPSADALAAYKENVQRMTGSSSTQIVAGSLKLGLGSIPYNPANSSQSTTNTPVPQNSTLGVVPPAQQYNGDYIAFFNYPYDGEDFVFCGASTNVQLVDLRNYVAYPALPAGAPWIIPTIVRCQADQFFQDADQHGHAMTRTIHIAACAQPPCNVDPRGHAGALTLSFPNGIPNPVNGATLNSPLDLYTNAGFANTPIDYLLMANGGDYPPNQAALPPPYFPYTPTETADYPWPHARVTDAISIGIYDWIRRGGANISVQAVTDWFNTPFNKTIVNPSNAQIHLYEFATNGTINYWIIDGGPTDRWNNVFSAVASDQQWFDLASGAISGQMYPSEYVTLHGYNLGGTTPLAPNPPLWPASSYLDFYDLIVKDNVHVEGLVNGGKHGGEPLGNQWDPAWPVHSVTNIAWAPDLTKTWSTIAEILQGQKAMAQTPPPAATVPISQALTGDRLPPTGPGTVRPTYLGSPNLGGAPGGMTGQAVDIRFRASGYPPAHVP